MRGMNVDSHWKNESDFLYRRLLGIKRPKENARVVLGNKEYRFLRGILRRNDSYSPSTAQVQDTFGYQWSRVSYNKAAHEFQVKWYDDTFPGCRRFLAKWLQPGASVLDAGCGAGFSALGFLGGHLRNVHYVGVDFSAAVDRAAHNFSMQKIPGEFMQDDITQLPFGKETFDVIFSVGVLHHTESVSNSLRRLVRHLKTNGRFLLWVFNRQPVIRVFTDDRIRRWLSTLGTEKAYKALRPLTKLGRAFAEVNAEIKIPEDIPILDIRAGRYDVHRFIYYFIFKCFYNRSLGMVRSNIQNFDWFRPKHAHTHTPKEIRAYCRNANLQIERMWCLPAGISVVAIKKS